MIEKDIVDYLKERDQLEAKWNELKAKDNILSTEQVILEEVERALRIVNSKINKLSGNR